MIFLVASRDITPPQSHPTLCTYKIETPKVVALAKRLLFSVWTVDREELGCDDVSTVQAFETI
jgi:hypothetical protein